MKKQTLCCIGHITLDKVVTPQSTVYMPGGTAYYCSYAMRHLNNTDYRLVTAVGESELNVVERMRNAGINVTALPSKHSVYFENIYGENQNDRTQRVLAKADPFTSQYLKEIEADIYHLGSLLADDFPVDVIRHLAGKGLVAVDSQGYLREVRNTRVYPVDWPEYEPAVITDATGCGDTYTIGYLYQRAAGASIEEAGRFAAAMSTLKIEKSGPFCGTEADILHCMRHAKEILPCFSL